MGLCVRVQNEAQPHFIFNHKNTYFALCATTLPVLADKTKRTLLEQANSLLIERRQGESSPAYTFPQKRGYPRLKHDEMEKHPNRIQGSLLWIALGLIALLYVYTQAALDRLDFYVMGVLSVAAIHIILTVSLNLINGITGQLSIGHAGFMAIGAYTTALFSIHLGTPIYLNLIFSGIVAGMAGILIGLPTLRLRGDYLAIATLGFGEIIRVVLQNLRFTGGAAGLGGIEWVDHFFLTQGVAIIVVLLIWRVSISAPGRAMVAVREDETAAETVGINTTRIKVMAFALGSFCAGIAGSLFAHRMTYISPDGFTFMKSIEVLVMLVLGGLGSITGSILSATVLTLLPEFLRFIDEWRMIIYPALLVITMLFRSRGLLGTMELDFGQLPSLLRRLRPQKAKAVSSLPAGNPTPPSPTENQQNSPLLEIKNLSISFGGLQAIAHFNVSINQGALHGLIGPNGAGKTTLFNVLTGMHAPDEGEILLDGKAIQGKSPHTLARLGIARTFQNIRLFKDLTVLDNVKVAYHLQAGYGLGTSLLQTPNYGRNEARIDEEARNLLKLFSLDQVGLTIARNLPYGAQRRLEIARALAVSPRLLLLDEPAAGMNAQETQELMELIGKIRDTFGLTIFLIEHDMSLVMKLCQTISVLDYGIKIFEGTAEEVRNEPRVIDAYLGEEVV